MLDVYIYSAENHQQLAKHTFVRSAFTDLAETVRIYIQLYFQWTNCTMYEDEDHDLVILDNKDAYKLAVYEALNDQRALKIYLTGKKPQEQDSHFGEKAAEDIGQYVKHVCGENMTNEGGYETAQEVSVVNIRKTQENDHSLNDECSEQPEINSTPNVEEFWKQTRGKITHLIEEEISRQLSHLQLSAHPNFRENYSVLKAAQYNLDCIRELLFGGLRDINKLPNPSDFVTINTAVEKEYACWLNKYISSYESCCRSFAMLTPYFQNNEDALSSYGNRVRIQKVPRTQQSFSADSTTEGCSSLRDQRQERNSASERSPKGMIYCTVLKSDRPVFLRSYDEDNGLYFKLFKIHINQRIPQQRLKASRDFSLLDTFMHVISMRKISLTEKLMNSGIVVGPLVLFNSDLSITNCNDGCHVEAAIWMIAPLDHNEYARATFYLATVDKFGHPQAQTTLLFELNEHKDYHLNVTHDVDMSKRTGVVGKATNVSPNDLNCPCPSMDLKKSRVERDGRSSNRARSKSSESGISYDDTAGTACVSNDDFAYSGSDSEASVSVTLQKVDMAEVALSSLSSSDYEVIDNNSSNC